MDSVPIGRLNMPPEEEQGMLQAALMACYRLDGHYLGMIRQDLAPLWRPIERRLSDPATALPPHWRPRYALFDGVADLHQEQIWWEEEGGPVRWPELETYVHAINRVVRDRLRLTRGDEPLWWALDCVHSELRGVEIVPESAWFAAIHEAAIKLNVSAFGATIDALGRNGEITNREHVDAPLALRVKDYMCAVRAAAERALNEELRRIESDLDSSYGRRNENGDIQHRNAVDLNRRLKRDVPILFRYLFHGIPLERSPDLEKTHSDMDEAFSDRVSPDRKTIKNLADDVGVDFPERISGRKRITA